MYWWTMKGNRKNGHRRSLLRSRRGATFVEVLIAIVVLGLIMASIPPVLLLITHSQFTWNEQRVAESISRNQVEYMKALPFQEDGSYGLVPHPSTFEISLSAQPVEDRLQEITIEISHVDKVVLTTLTYKVDRLAL